MVSLVIGPQVIITWIEIVTKQLIRSAFWKQTGHKTDSFGAEI
jgi:hypothetical protein